MTVQKEYQGDALEQLNVGTQRKLIRGNVVTGRHLK